MRVVVFLLLLSVLTSHAQEEKRLALIIGNGAYEHGGQLQNPVNDANLMASTLQQLDFKVIKYTDTNLRGMQNAYLQFIREIPSYDINLFFYAGHGMQVDGVNYLLPIDCKAETAESLQFEAFDIAKVSDAFARSREKTNIMILDACRDNPFRSWSRGGERGFKAVTNQGAGTIISFATTEGQTASDGDGINGLYTKHLVKQMMIPQNITDVFQNTRANVVKESDYNQVPQEWNMLVGNFYFNKQGEAIKIPEFNEISDLKIGTRPDPKDQFFIDMVYVEGGTFMMGSNDGDKDERPVHEVVLSSFEIGRYEVTQKQWEDVMGPDESRNEWCSDCPVDSKSIVEVLEFINKANSKYGMNYRLPTEAEWEYAARGGQLSQNSKYSGSETLADVGWYYANSNIKLQPVGKKQPNELGIHDMSGNVWEFCNDLYHSTYYRDSEKVNPQGSARGKYRVLRGGSIYLRETSLTNTNRFRFATNKKGSSSVGFRLAQDVK